MSLFRSFVCLLASCALLPLTRSPRMDAAELVKKPVRTDSFGDPLPAGVLARMGTIRFRHGDFVQRVLFSSDGKTVFSGSADQTVRAWETATGKEVQRFIGHESRVEALALSPDGKYLASGGQDATVRIWDLANGKERDKFADSRGPIYGLVFSTDGKTLIGCSTSVLVWDLESGKKIMETEDLRSWIPCVALSHDSKTVISGSDDGLIRFWDLTTGKETKGFSAHSKAVHSLAISPDGKWMASAGWDGKVSLRGAATGEELRILFQEKQSTCSRIAFSPDSKALACAGGDDRTVHLFDVTTGKELMQCKGHQYWVEDVAFSPDGKTLVSGSADCTVRLWDVETGKEIRPLHSHQGPLSVALSPDDKTLACAGGDPAIHLWNTTTGKEMQLYVAQEAPVRHIAFSPDSRKLISVDFGNLAITRDITTGKELGRLEAKGDHLIALSPDGRILASRRGSDASLRLWDIATGKQIWSLKDASRVAFSADGRILVGAGDHEQPRLWDISSCKELTKLNGDSLKVDRVALSPDGKLAAFSGLDRIIRVWNLATNDLVTLGQDANDLKKDSTHRRRICMVLSPDGRTLACDNGEQDIHLWEVASGQERYVLNGHQGPVMSLMFSHDGRRLASGSMDTTALLWDLTGWSQADQPPANKLSAKELDGVWSDLAGQDAAKAYRAIWSLIAAPKSTVPFLRANVKAAAAVTEERFTKLLRDLDSNDFDVRERATAALDKLAELVEPTLAKALKTGLPAEASRRVEIVLASIKSQRLRPSGESLRHTRALEVLENLNTPDAREVLQELAKGAPEAWLTQEAKTSLERSAKRTVP